MHVSNTAAGLTVGSLIARTGLMAGSRTALVWEGRRISYRELVHQSHQVANMLVGSGLRAGDRVALLMGNRPEFIVLYLGAALAGCPVVPLNPRLHAAELRPMLDDAAPRMLFCDSPDSAAVATDWAAGRGAIAVDVEREMASLLQKASSRSVSQGPTPDTPLAIAYTSGTTGMPKGVVIRHRNALASLVNGAVAFGLNAGLRNVIFQPLVFHPLFVGHILGPLAVGGQIALMPAFDPERYLDLAQRERATFLVHVPTTIRRVLEEQQRRPRDLSSVATLFTGGAPITTSLLEQAAAFFPRVTQGYGLTEATNIVACTTGRLPDGPQDCGSILPGSEVRIVGDEIQVRGEIVMAGYWGKDSDTAAAIQDGWLRTGDLGSVDGSGRLRVTGRIKETIISGGVKIHATEVEEAVARHPAVAEVAVAGVPDPEWGEVVSAWVVCREGATLSSSQLLSHCEGCLARFKRPRHVYFLPSLPRNANGKVRKDQLRQLITEG